MMTPICVNRTFLLRTPLLRLLCSKTQKPNVKTAAVIVIGDEILNGEVLDTNSNYVAKTLHNLGVKLEKISVIGDNIDEIANETKLFSERYDYVITTGGIGPTHDDVTFTAIAKAFNEELLPHPTLVKVCSKFYNTTDLDAPGMKLCFIPASAKLNFGDVKPGERKGYPNVSIKNVYIFPGIPQLLEKSLDMVAPKLFSSNNKFYKNKVYFNVTEQVILDVLNRLVEEFPDVMFGSYPELFNSTYKVKITIESTNEEATTKATKKLLESVPKDFLVK
ncbi:PREDICTED: FAD synthase-like [Nicrophorus vespilloides]|uniref:FAD synthase-like n=1 Tax=Nicrophorus vespilloides TaxID=110193 RepID=A0ABM1MLZ9_NICVS|nr:PREDICTED: FAD synthase-like [Nicrophorus vespilloides]